MTDLQTPTPPISAPRPVPVVPAARTPEPVPAPRPTAAPDPGPTPPPGRRRWAVRPLVLYATSRLLVAQVVEVVARWDAAHGTNTHAGPWPPLGQGASRALAALGRWDGAWYRHLAVHGYPGPADLPDAQRTLAFFPLFPTLVRGLAAATPLSPLAAGVVVSLTAGAVGVLLAWRLVARLRGAEAADRATAVLCFFPGSVVLSMAYSEGLLLAAAAGTMLLLLRQRWVLAGAVGALATLSRPNGVAVVAMCAVAAVAAVRAEPSEPSAPRWRRWRPLAAPALASAGVLGFFAYLAVHTGWRLAWFRSQAAGWHDSIGWWAAPLSHVSAVWHGRAVGWGSGQLNPLVGVLGLALVAWSGRLLLRWRPPAPILAYALVSIALALASQRVGARPRMVLAAFPLVLALGVEVRGRAYGLLLAAEVALLCVVAGLFLGSLAMTP